MYKIIDNTYNFINAYVSIYTIHIHTYLYCYVVLYCILVYKYIIIIIKGSLPEDNLDGVRAIPNK